jgi:hypothetical protein
MVLIIELQNKKPLEKMDYQKFGPFNIIKQCHGLG